MIKVFDERQTRFSPRYLVRGAALLVAVLCFGTVGYMAIEKWRFLDALYMTVITITTVGFKEVRNVSDAGQIFTIVLIFFGIGIVAYSLGLVVQAMVLFQMREILGRRKLGLIKRSMKDHYILCGYGRIGKTICKELIAHKIPVLVIDASQGMKSPFEELGIPYIIDDATSEDVLMEAHIDRAKGLVTVVSSDADNLFITMTARGLNPDLFILTRTEEEQNQKKFLRAGADRAFLPYLIGGRKMADAIVKPAVSDFLDLTVHDKDIELKMEELQVKDQSGLAGVNLVESGIRQDLNIIIVAIRKGDGEMTFNPSSLTKIEAGDTLIALGNKDDLEALAKLLSEPRPDQKKRPR